MLPVFSIQRWTHCIREAPPQNITWLIFPSCWENNESNICERRSSSLATIFSKPFTVRWVLYVVSLNVKRSLLCNYERIYQEKQQAIKLHTYHVSCEHPSSSFALSHSSQTIFVNCLRLFFCSTGSWSCSGVLRIRSRKYCTKRAVNVVPPKSVQPDAAISFGDCPLSRRNIDIFHNKWVNLLWYNVFL